MKTIRLLYPDYVSGGLDTYYFGANLLAHILPENKNQPLIKVDIAQPNSANKIITDGIYAKGEVLSGIQNAMAKIEKENPDKIITIGGNCLVSLAPFDYLHGKYKNTGIVWIDAHPDINLPYDEYKGYHAMALTACLGMGDEEILQLLPGKFKVSNTLIVGLRSWDEGMKERQKNLGIKGLSPEEVAKDSSSILKWLKGTGASKVVVHFDMDVIDPADMIAGVGVEPNGMKIDEVVRVINNIASKYDLVGLTVAEPMPRIAIKLRNMLDRLPLLK